MSDDRLVKALKIYNEGARHHIEHVSGSDPPRLLGEKDHEYGLRKKGKSKSKLKAKPPTYTAEQFRKFFTLIRTILKGKRR